MYQTSYFCQLFDTTSNKRLGKYLERRLTSKCVQVCIRYKCVINMYMYYRILLVYLNMQPSSLPQTMSARITAECTLNLPSLVVHILEKVLIQ